MPKKVRELKRLIKQAGWVYQVDRGKGSHSYWKHPLLPDDPLCIPGQEGDDAKKYLEKEVNLALKKLQDLANPPEDKNEVTLHYGHPMVR